MHVRPRTNGGTGRTGPCRRFPCGDAIAGPTRCPRLCSRPAPRRCSWRFAAILPAGAGPSTPIARSPPPPRSARASPASQPLTKEVYGYLPYWRLDSGTVGPAPVRARLHDRVLRARHQGRRQPRHRLGRLQGVRRRRRGGGDQRGPRQGRPGRPDLPALRLAARCPKMSAFLAQHGRPGPVHRRRRSTSWPRARPTARASTSSRCSAADARVVPGVRRPVPDGDAGALPRPTLVNATSAGAGEDARRRASSRSSTAR